MDKKLIKYFRVRTEKLLRIKGKQKSKKIWKVFFMGEMPDLQSAEFKKDEDFFLEECKRTTQADEAKK